MQQLQRDESKQSFDTIPKIKVKDGNYKYLDKEMLVECYKSLEIESSSSDEIERMILAPEDPDISLEERLEQRTKLEREKVSPEKLKYNHRVIKEKCNAKELDKLLQEMLETERARSIKERFESRMTYQRVLNAHSRTREIQLSPTNEMSVSSSNRFQSRKNTEASPQRKGLP